MSDYTGSTQPYGTPGNGNPSATIDKLSSQAKDVAGQVADKVDDLKGKASTAVETAKSKVSDVKSYLQEGDANTYWSDFRTVIKQHPGKSLIGGLVVGMLVGRVLR